MMGYHNNEAATNMTIMDGWLHTGDIAKYDSTAQFFIVDRLKELIKVKGLQVGSYHQGTILNISYINLFILGGTF